MQNETKTIVPGPSEDRGLDSVPDDVLQLIIFKVLGHDNVFDPLDMALDTVAEWGLQRRQNFAALAQVRLKTTGLRAMT
jgi:hypothetical protein